QVGFCVLVQCISRRFPCFPRCTAGSLRRGRAAEVTPRRLHFLSLVHRSARAWEIAPLRMVVTSAPPNQRKSDALGLFAAAHDSARHSDAAAQQWGKRGARKRGAQGGRPRVVGLRDPPSSGVRERRGSDCRNAQPVQCGEGTQRAICLGGRLGVLRFVFFAHAGAHRRVGRRNGAWMELAPGGERATARGCSLGGAASLPLSADAATSATRQASPRRGDLVRFALYGCESTEQPFRNFNSPRPRRKCCREGSCCIFSSFGFCINTYICDLTDMVAKATLCFYFSSLFYVKVAPWHRQFYS
ncbi:uncharacterized protein Tco025E_03039, partial [Trypanosoma conorhini]